MSGTVSNKGIMGAMSSKSRCQPPTGQGTWVASGCKAKPSSVSLASLQHPQQPSDLTPWWGSNRYQSLQPTERWELPTSGQRAPTWLPGPPVWLLTKFIRTLPILPGPTSPTCHYLRLLSSNGVSGGNDSNTRVSQRKSLTLSGRHQHGAPPPGSPPCPAPSGP